MRRQFFLFLLLLVIINTATRAQNKECRLKPKRFPSAFTHMTSDFAQMNLQADVLPRRFFQIESGLMAGMVLNRGQQSFGYNVNVFRFGLGKRLEFRTGVSFPGDNLQTLYPENKPVNIPAGAGIKFNMLPESSTTPGLSVLAEYNYLGDHSAYQITMVVDKWVARILKISMAAGPQITSNSTSKIAYSMGMVLKERDQKVGVYGMATNRLFYLQNVVNLGIVYTDNLNYQFTAGFGIHENEGLFMVSYSGLFNHRHLRRTIGSYF